MSETTLDSPRINDIDAAAALGAAGASLEAIANPERRSAQGYEYDVFLSCAESDKDWVETDLLKPLRASRIKVTWEWDFYGGVDVTAARDEAVEKSRHTMLVLTPAWCDSPLAEDARRAKFLDPNTKDRKILPLMGQKCNPPVYLQRLKPYEFTDVLVRQATMPKLLEELGLSRQTVNEVMSQFAQLGIRALMDLMMSPAVLGAVQGIEAAFVAARTEIEELTRCKTMHECFHSAYDEFLSLKEDKGKLQSLLQLSADDRDDWQSKCEDAWVAVESFVNDKLDSAIMKLVNFANSSGFPPDQIPWSPSIQRSIGELKRASESRDIKRLNLAAAQLTPIISTWLSRFDKQLLDAAQRLRLSAVVAGLSTIRDSVTKYSFQQDVVTRLDVFSRGIAALSALGQRVQDLVVCHHHLQWIDDVMQTLAYPFNCADDIEMIRFSWPELATAMDALVPLNNSDWSVQFQATRKEFDDALGLAPQDDIDKPAINKISIRFGRFRSTARNGFASVDLELVRLCDKLQKIREELGEAIRNLQHE